MEWLSERTCVRNIGIFPWKFGWSLSKLYRLIGCRKSEVYNEIMCLLIIVLY